MKTDNSPGLKRRDFIKASAVSMAAIGGMSIAPGGALAKEQEPVKGSRSRSGHKLNEAYSGEYLNQVAFPLGGIGAGMVCLEGTGALSHLSLRNHPDVFNEPCVFAAISVLGKKPIARVLEGPVPARKIFGRPGTGNGAGGTTYGLPRFSSAAFEARFPFCKVALSDPKVPVLVEITGWSPFEPGAADDSSLPVAALEYEFTNKSRGSLEAVFSFNARNFMSIGGNPQAVRPIEGGFILWSGASQDRPWEEGAFSATVSGPGVKVNHAWFRGGWWDPLTMAWKDVEQGECFDRPPVQEGGHSPGGSLFVPISLAPGASKTIRLRLAWYVGKTNLRVGKDLPGSAAAADPGKHRPWYSGRFSDINGVSYYWEKHYDTLRQKAERFRKCFYESTLPPEVMEAVAANLTILKSPTVLRQPDGKLWCWEGCNDNSGCCAGTCTHVWNYAQALPHLFPALERTLRDTEFGPSQSDAGHQTFRSALPIRPVDHDFHAAADGQLGGIMKVYRDWRISGDTEWLRGLWPSIKRSLDFCISTWDPDHTGTLREPHHNTYDIEFWGPDGMCSSFYLGALQAAVLMAKALGDAAPLYSELLQKGKEAVEASLFNGEYFFQKIEWKNLHASDPTQGKRPRDNYSPEAMLLLEKEGPKYQYGSGCLSDGVLGDWIARVCGVPAVLSPDKVTQHLAAVHKHNLKQDLSEFPNPQRPSYACGAEGGLVLCTWPKGGELSLPFVYSNEVWTGIEYQVASHLMQMGKVREGLEIVRVCRNRYDGRTRNPFNEYECGHWYARAMSSYALMFGLTGARYDAIEKVLYLNPTIKGDFRCFFSAQGSYGTVGVKRGKPFYEPVSGNLDISRIVVEKRA